MRVTPENLRQVVAHLMSRPELALDTETSGLDRSDLPFAFSIADEQSEYYFDERIVPGLWDRDELVDLFFVKTPRITWILQNAKFDMKMLVRRGHEVMGRIIDIAIAARIVKNDHLAYGLDAQAKRHGMEKSKEVDKYITEHKLKESRKRSTGIIDVVPRFDRVPVDIMEAYATKDARLTFDLWKIYKHQLDEDDLRVLEMESRLTPVCFMMEERGLQLDWDYTAQAREEELSLALAARNEFKTLTGVDYVNSAKSLCPIFEKEGERIQYTEKGNPSLTDDILETYTSPAARIVQKIRHYEKRVSTYYDNYINLCDDQHLIHPDMKQAGTTTGRFSYSDPNLQNIPKDEDPEDFAIRGCFVPHPGHVFVSLDYRQMEYRMMLAYANERRMIDAVMGGADVHQATADLLGISRKHAKTLNFAILYGAGVEKIARMLGCTVAEARNLKTRYFLGLPAVEQMVNSIIDKGRARGYVKNWLGRKLRADYEFCYALPNHLIQGGGADVVKTAMNRIDTEVALGSSTGMILQVHDQLVFSLRPKDLHLVPQIKEIMENTFPPMNGMKLTVDVTWSPKSLAEADMMKGIPDEHTALRCLQEAEAGLATKDGSLHG